MPSDQRNWPPVYALAAAWVLWTVTVKDFVFPGAMVNEAGLMLTSNPSIPVWLAL
jgi:hypothetical protein